MARCSAVGPPLRRGVVGPSRGDVGTRGRHVFYSLVEPQRRGDIAARQTCGAGVLHSGILQSCLRLSDAGREGAICPRAATYSSVSAAFDGAGNAEWYSVAHARYRDCLDRIIVGFSAPHTS